MPFEVPMQLPLSPSHRVRSFVYLAAAAVALAAVPWAVPQPPTARAPVPAEAARTRAEALVRKLYASEYQEARAKPEAAQDLAATLLREAKDTKDDPALRFAALGEARDLAAQAGDAETVLEAIEELVRHYAVKGLGMKTAGLATAAARAGGKEAGEKVVEAALGLIDEALYEDDYDAAHKLIEAAESAGLKVKNLALFGRIDRRGLEVEAARKEFDRVRPFAERLAKDPADAEANYHLGRYTCLIRGNWERGAPLLAKGNSGPWKALAGRELARPTDPGQQAQAGDECARLAEVEKGQAKRNLQRRALHWYQLALPKLAGLTRKRVEAEVRDLAALFHVAPPTPEIVAELRRINYPGSLQVMTLSADGRFILTGGSQDLLVRLWDVQTTKELRQFAGHLGNIEVVALSADGKYGASGDTNGQLKLWDLQTGNLVRQFFGHTDFVRGLSFFPDGKRLLSASDDKTLRLWDLATGLELKRLTGHTNYINSLSVNRAGTRAFSGGIDMTARLWDLVRGQEIRSLPHTAALIVVALSPDGKLGVTSSNDKVVRVWDVEAGKELRRLPHPNQAWCLAFAPDGKRLFSGSGRVPPVNPGGVGKGAVPNPPTRDNYLHVWDVEAGREVRRLEGHTSLLRAIAVSADGRIVASAANDHTVRIWGEKK